MHQGLGLTPGPSASLELPAEASATKVSKPVLFILKMTDFQWAHKRDSSVEQAGKRRRAAQFRHDAEKGRLRSPKAPSDAIIPTEIVIAGLNPAIHSTRAQTCGVATAWTPGFGPRMTTVSGTKRLGSSLAVNDLRLVGWSRSEWCAASWPQAAPFSRLAPLTTTSSASWNLRSKLRPAMPRCR